MSMDLYDPKELDANFLITIAMGQRMMSGKFSELNKPNQSIVLAAAEENARDYCKRTDREFMGLVRKPQVK